MTEIKCVSLKDIAKKAGVSTALVSFVLNGKGKMYRVSEQTEKHILRIAMEMNYQPNMAAKSLRSGKTGTIGVVVPDITNAFFSQIARYIEDISAKLGYTAFFGSSDENTEKLDALVKGLINKGVDGLIVVPTENSEKVLTALGNTELPVILLDRLINGMSAVVLDNYKAAYMATRHLIDSGLRSIAMLAYDVSLSHMKERIRGYRQAMTDSGLKSGINIGYLKHNNLNRSVQKVMPQIVESGADALLFATNTIAINSLRYIIDAGIKIPDRLAIVCFDASEAFDFFYSPLTYVKQPVDVMAQKAVEVLAEAMASNKRAVQMVVVEGDLVVRSSSVKQAEILEPV
jgi:LacI family transcriptional regulator